MPRSHLVQISKRYNYGKWMCGWEFLFAFLHEKMCMWSWGKSLCRAEISCTWWASDECGNWRKNCPSNKFTICSNPGSHAESIADPKNAQGNAFVFSPLPLHTYSYLLCPSPQTYTWYLSLELPWEWYQKTCGCHSRNLLLPLLAAGKSKMKVPPKLVSGEDSVLRLRTATCSPCSDMAFPFRSGDIERKYLNPSRQSHLHYLSMIIPPNTSKYWELGLQHIKLAGNGREHWHLIQNFLTPAKLKFIPFWYERYKSS